MLDTRMRMGGGKRLIDRSTMPTIKEGTTNIVTGGACGGKKIIRLENGWLIAMLRNTSTTDTIFFEKSEDSGHTWTPLVYSNSESAAGAAITSRGNTVYAFWAKSSTAGGVRSYFVHFDATTVSYEDITASTVDIANNQTTFNSTGGLSGSITMSLNPAKNSIYCAWISKDATYSQSFNIRYRAGTINSDDSIAWGTVIQVSFDTNTNYNYQFISIESTTSNIPVIVASWFRSDAGIYEIRSWRKPSSSWIMSEAPHIFSEGYTQREVATFYDKNTNIIHAVWESRDSVNTGTFNIRYCTSTDGGVNWSVPAKLTIGNVYNQQRPNVIADKNGKIYVIWAGTKASTGSAVYNLRMITNSGTWSSITEITDSTSPSYINTQMCHDILDFDLPIFMFEDRRSAPWIIRLYGKWYE